MPNRTLIAFIAVVSFQFCAYGQSGRDAFQEIGASYGAALNPHSAPAATAAYGFGLGRNTISLEIGRSSFGNCGLGLGPDVCSQYGGNANYNVSVSGFRLTDFSLNYQRDLYHPAQSRFTIYGGMGIGYFKSTFTQTANCGICPTLPLVVSRESVNSVGFGVNSGFRVSVWKGIGVRAGLEAWLVPGNTAAGTSNDTLVRATFGLYYRSKW